MMTFTLSDPHIAENVKAAMNLRSTGVFSDEEIQRMYDEQIKRDAAEAALEGGES